MRGRHCALTEQRQALLPEFLRQRLVASGRRTPSATSTADSRSWSPRDSRMSTCSRRKTTRATRSCRRWPPSWKRTPR